MMSPAISGFSAMIIVPLAMGLLAKAPKPFLREGLTSKYSVVNRGAEGRDGEDVGVEEDEREEVAETDRRKALGEMVDLSDREATLSCPGLSPY